MSEQRNNQWFLLDRLQGTKALDARGYKQNFPQHHHDSFQVTVATRGVFKNQVGEQLLITDHQALSITQPREVHATVCDEVLGHWFFTLYLPEAQVQNRWQQTQNINLDAVITAAELVAKVHRIRQLLLEDGEVPRGWIEQLIDGLLQHQSDQASPGRVDWSAFVESLGMDATDSTVKNFAAKNSMSQYQLIRAFQARVGMTPHQFLLNQKTDEAKALIEAGLSLTDAALEAGFYDAPHLCQVFKRFTGSTPQAYQRAIFSKT